MCRGRCRAEAADGERRNKVSTFHSLMESTVSARFNTMKLCFASSALFFAFSSSGVGAVPTDPSYFEQIVDHNNDNSEATYKQRFYEKGDYWSGPGAPIFLVMGGEGAIPPETGLFYPYVNDVLAEEFGGYVLEPEHRFYGDSQPTGVAPPGVSNEDLKNLMTPLQALADAKRLVKAKQKELGCTERGTPNYCPVFVIGGSYPGFLSFSMRLLHGDVIDASYAASAPIRFYAQQIDQYDYYELITKSAERSLAGCAANVRDALADVSQKILSSPSVDDIASKIGVCPGPKIPEYSASSVSNFQEEIMMVIGYTFANYNMGNYPPDDTTDLYKTCLMFGDELSAAEKVKTLLLNLTGDEDAAECFDMNSQLPAGPNATITSGDWSGVGTGGDGSMWDFQTCSMLVETIGFSGSRDMFPPREWTMDWLTQHCGDRFDVEPKPLEYAREWGFDDIMQNTNVTRVLFTNGLNDGWAVGSILESLDEGERQLIAMNFPNGAHHSDLSHETPGPNDTEDIQQGHKDVIELFHKWLADIKAEGKF